MTFHLLRFAEGRLIFFLPDFFVAVFFNLSGLDFFLAVADGRLAAPRAESFERIVLVTFFIPFLHCDCVGFFELIARCPYSATESPAAHSPVVALGTPSRFGLHSLDPSRALGMALERIR